MQEEAGPEGTGTGRCSAGLLEMITGELTLRTDNITPIEEGTGLYSVEALQVGVQARRLGLHSLRLYGHEPQAHMALLRIHALRGC